MSETLSQRHARHAEYCREEMAAALERGFDMEPGDAADWAPNDAMTPGVIAPGYAELDTQRDELGQGAGPRPGDGVETRFDVAQQRQQFQGLPLAPDHAANAKPWVTEGMWRGPSAVLAVEDATLMTALNGAFGRLLHLHREDDEAAQDKHDGSACVAAPVRKSPGYADLDVQRDELGQGAGPRPGDGVLTMFDVTAQRQQFQGVDHAPLHPAYQEPKPYVTLGQWQGPCAVLPLREQPGGFVAIGEEPF